MSLRDVGFGVLGAVLGAIATTGVAAFNYYTYYKPSLEVAQKMAAIAERAQKRAEQAEQQLTTLQDQAAQLKNNSRLRRDYSLFA